MLLLGIGLRLGLGSDLRVRVSNSRLGTARERVEKVTRQSYWAALSLSFRQISINEHNSLGSPGK